MSGKIRPLSREEVRGLDARAAGEFGLPSLLLMENAGRGGAAWLFDHGVGPGSRVLILCGGGNNGGDGGVVARHLDGGGVDVRVAWLTPVDRLRGDAAVQRGILARSGVTLLDWGGGGAEAVDGLAAELAGADWVVDGLLGTGLTRAVEGSLAEVIARVNGAGKPVLALDLPSGLDADAGRPLGIAVRARATATFVAPKVGFTAPGAAAYTGEVAVIAIGLPRRLLEPFRIP